MINWDFNYRLTGKTFPVKVTSPVHAESLRTLRPEINENNASVKAHPAEGPSLATAPAGK